MKTIIAILILVAVFAGLNLALAFANLTGFLIAWATVAIVASVTWAVVHIITEVYD
jgi:hypothetical protein